MKPLVVLLAIAAGASLQTEPHVAPPTASTTSARPTGFLYDDVYLKHLSGNSGHPERPERLTAIWNGLQKAGLINDIYRLAPRRATDNELALVHERSYIQLVRRELANVRGYKELSTGDTLVSADSLDAALSASGGVLNGVDAVMTGKVKNAFCAVRPPGHHAGPTRGMGFCIFNNVAIAARYVQKTYGVQRVLIVDQDYHHGNGTQDIFYEDGSVFYFSTHHYGAYPGTGAASETGRGKGAGTILNVPLPPGAGDEPVLQAFQRKLVPAARAFKPDFILISAGFDAMRNDGLGVFDVTPQGFAAIARVVVNLANELCQGRVRVGTRRRLSTRWLGRQRRRPCKGPPRQVVVLICKADVVTMSDDQPELRAVEQQLARAWATRDRATIERILAREWSVTRLMERRCLGRLSLAPRSTQMRKSLIAMPSRTHKPSRLRRVAGTVA